MLERSRLSSFLVVLLAVACTRTVYVKEPAKPATPTATPTPTPTSTPTPTPTAQRTFRIVDAGDIYPSINTTDCLAWPSAEVKRRGGEDAWGGYYPRNGDVGTLIGTARHCDSGILVLFLDVQGYYVPIGEQGTEETTPGAARRDPTPGPTAQPTPGSPASGAFIIVDAGQLYSSINQTDCLDFPSPDIKRMAGSDGWGSYYPANGDRGFAVWKAVHCDSGVTVVLLDVNGYYVPIGESGLKPDTGAGPVGGAPQVGGVYQITDEGQVYPNINETDCLTWPSPDVKARGGVTGWGGFYPKNGDQGNLVGTSRHCSSAVTVYFLQVGNYYVAVGDSGVRHISGGGPVAGGPAAGSRWRIVDNGQIYPAINQIDCLTWPSPEVQRKAGENAWGSWYPQNGDVGVLLGTSPHCSSNVLVYILQIGDRYVAIGESGITAN